MTKDKDLAALIAGCLRTDESSQMELYKQFYSYAMSITLRYAANRESSLEMLNDGFLKVFSKIDQYDSDFPFKPWLRRILINASIDHYRKYQQNRIEELWVPEGVQSTYNEALDQLDFDDLIKIIQLLSPAYRVVFNLYVVEGLTHAEISDQLNISIGSSKSNLAKARKKIKELLRSSHDIHFKSEKYG